MGIIKNAPCPVCAGIGAVGWPANEPEECPECRGSGVVRVWHVLVELDARLDYGVELPAGVVVERIDGRSSHVTRVALAVARRRLSDGLDAIEGALSALDNSHRPIIRKASHAPILW